MSAERTGQSGRGQAAGPPERGTEARWPSPQGDGEAGGHRGDAPERSLEAERVPVQMEHHTDQGALCADRYGCDGDGPVGSVPLVHARAARPLDAFLCGRPDCRRRPTYHERHTLVLSPGRVTRSVDSSSQGDVFARLTGSGGDAPPTSEVTLRVTSIRTMTSNQDTSFRPSRTTEVQCLHDAT